MSTVIVKNNRITSPFLRVSSLNNNGISAIVEDGNYALALRSMTRSLRLVKELGLLTSSFSHDDDTTTSVRQPNTELLSRVQVAADAGSNDVTYHDSIVFGQAFLLPSTNDDASISDGDYDYYASLIIFNMALIYHLKGTSSTNDHCIMKAEKLYRLALALLEKNEDAFSTKCTDDVVVKLASIANLVQLRCYWKGDTVRGQEGLVNQAATLVQQVTPTLHDILYQDPKIGALLMYVVLSLVQSTPTIAAAA